jgi:hypothetical protein
VEIPIAVETFDINTTLPLPTEDQWIQAMASNPDTSRIVKEILNDRLVPKADLIEKA